MQRGVLELAALTHDVVYDGVPGADELASAAWAVDRMAVRGLDPATGAAVRRLVEGTAEHMAAEGDRQAQCLYDADLAVLGADEAAYARYAAQVREEYRRFDDESWRLGRTAVLTELLDRQALFALPAARSRWEAQASRDLTAALARLA